MTYDSKEVSKLLSISLRQLQYWDEKEIVKPSIRAAIGKGTMRLYSNEDLIQLRVVKRLRDFGISLKKIKNSINYLKYALPYIDKPLVELSFVTDGETIFQLTCDQNLLIDTLRSGQITWHIPMSTILLEIKSDGY